MVRGEEAPFERLLSALLYSAIIYGVLLVTAHGLGLQKADLVEFHDGEKSLGDDLLAAFAILLVFPGLIAITGAPWMASQKVRPRILRSLGSSETHSTDSAWNDLFAQQGPCLIRATLNDGRAIGGLYDENSVAGYSEQVPDLYLSQRWEFDSEGWFAGPTGRSLGVWLSGQSILVRETKAGFKPIGKIDGPIEPPPKPRDAERSALPPAYWKDRGGKKEEKD